MPSVNAPVAPSGRTKFVGSTWCRASIQSRSANGNNLCGDHDYQGGGKEPNGTARLIAAFCRSDRALSYLVGSVDGVTGPDDPKFVAFVRQATMRLFTPRDDRQERDRCFMPDC